MAIFDLFPRKKSKTSFFYFNITYAFEKKCFEY